MDQEFKIVLVDEPEWAIIGGGISSYNKQQAGEDNVQTVCFVLRDPNEEVVGGVIGAIFWDWFHVDLMWIQEKRRGRGYGRRLLALAEGEARKRGAKHAYLDSFSFQAPGFYEKHGKFSANYTSSPTGTNSTFSQNNCEFPWIAVSHLSQPGQN